MGNFLDILSGRIFNFRNASGEDVNSGSSDKLIVTPKALSKSDVFSNTSLALVFVSSLTSKTSTLAINPIPFVLPSNGFFFRNRKSSIQAQLFVMAMADSAAAGEVCLVDAVTNDVIPNTTLSFKNTAWECVAGNVTTLEAGKTYALAVRKVSGATGKAVQVKAATITLKLLSAQ